MLGLIDDIFSFFASLTHSHDYHGIRRECPNERLAYPGRLSGNTAMEYDKSDRVVSPDILVFIESFFKAYAKEILSNQKNKAAGVRTRFSPQAMMPLATVFLKIWSTSTIFH